MSQVLSAVRDSVAHLQVFPLALTLVAYTAAVRLQRLARGSPLANPTLVAIGIVVFVLSITGISYGDYFAANQPINIILGPAVVALGVPLFRHLALIRQRAAPLLLALIVGSSCAIISVVELGRAFGLSRIELLSLAPRSATAGVSMAVSRQIGGSPPLTAVLTVTGGIAGRGTGKLRAERVAYSRPGRPRLRHGAGKPRHRHGSRVSGRPDGRHVRGSGDGPQCHRHGRSRAGAGSLADTLILSASSE